MQLHPLQGGRDVEGAIAFTLRAAEARYAWTAGDRFPEVKDSSVKLPAILIYLMRYPAHQGTWESVANSCDTQLTRSAQEAQNTPVIRGWGPSFEPVAESLIIIPAEKLKWKHCRDRKEMWSCASVLDSTCRQSKTKLNYCTCTTTCQNTHDIPLKIKETIAPKSRATPTKSQK